MAKPEQETETTNPAVEEAEAVLKNAELEVDEETRKLLDRVSKRYVVMAGAAAACTVAFAVMVKCLRNKDENELVEGEDYTV